MRASAGLASVLLTAAALAREAPKTSTFTLDNGMKFIVEEDHDIPNIAMYLFFRVGSRNERPGTTGISHFFEHMMFNGSKKYGPRQFDIEMEKAGGRNNAYTSRDLTVYTDWFPRTALRLMFDMESDRISNLSFDPKMVESERGVVLSERRTRTDNSVFGLLAENVSAAAYIAHPYGWPVVGWPSDIQSWTMEDLKSHYKMGYAPNNCTVVIVGDTTADEITRLAKEFFEPIPRHEPPPPVRTVEPEQRGERRVIVNKQAQLPIQMISYHVTNGSHPDFVPLEVIGAILSEGRSSRLYSRLVDRDVLALTAGQFMDQELDPGVMTIFVRPRAGADIGKAEAAVYDEVEKLRSTEVSALELRKAKNLLLTSLYREMKTIGGRANLLGDYEIFNGDFRKLYTAEAEIEAVSPADVQRVAKKYLSSRNRTVGTLVPERAGEPGQ